MHQTTLQNIKRTFYTEIQKRFNTIQVKDESLAYMCAAIWNKITENDKEYIEGPITETELKMAIKKAPKRKSPGEDGITTEFYSWGQEKITDDLLRLYNIFFQEGSIPKSITRGIILCIPKKKLNQNR